ncbi:hypothetical protein Tco_0308866 [Tanacetum coccineum]
MAQQPHRMSADPSHLQILLLCPAPREKLDFLKSSETKTNFEMADTQAEINLSQGPFPDTTSTKPQSKKHCKKENWIDVEMLMQGAVDINKEGRSVDEYDAFVLLETKSIHDYFVLYHKHVNDMKITPDSNFQLKSDEHQVCPTTIIRPIGERCDECQTEHGNPTTPYVQILLILKVLRGKKVHVQLKEKDILLGSVKTQEKDGPSQYFKDKAINDWEAKGERRLLDAEAEAFSLM